MKRTQTTTTKEYDTNGKLLREIIETVEEEDADGRIYPYTIANPFGTCTSDDSTAPSVTTTTARNVSYD